MLVEGHISRAIAGLVLFALTACATPPVETTTAPPTTIAPPSAQPIEAPTATARESPEAVDEPRPPRPLLMPAQISARPALPFCGHDTVVRGLEGDIGDQEPWDCLITTREAGGVAELIRDSPTIEGAPIRQIYRLLPDGGVEWWTDSTRDPFGTRQWTRSVCGRLESHQADAAVAPVYIPEDCEAPEVILDAERPEAPSGDEMAMLEALILFAREPGERTLDRVPLDPDGVWLGLSDGLSVRRTPDELADPRAWRLDAEAFRGRVGPFSALEALGNWDPSTLQPQVREASVTVGEHPHCASPAVPAPVDVADLRRLSVQPVGAHSCLSWWTVDLFLNPGGAIEAITLDLYEP